MHVLSVRDALGGRWAGNLTGWGILFVPTTLLIVLQEMTTGGTLLSALLLGVISHGATGILLISWASILHRRFRIIPLGVMFAGWTLVGVVRGSLWAAWHQWVVGDAADLPYRIGIWIAISVIWSPLFTYTLAQLDHRRVLLSGLSKVRQERAFERARTDQSALQRRATLVATVQRTISPVIAELHRGLSAVSPDLTDASLSAMSDRLSRVAYDAARVLAPADEQSESPAPPDQRAPLSAALDFPQDRPVYAAALAGITLLPLVLPDALRARGLEFALHIVGAVAAIVIVLTLTLFVVRWARLKVGRLPEVVFVFAFLIPGIAGSATLALFAGLPPPSSYLPLILILPFGALFCGANVSAAVGLAFSNEDLAQRVALVHDEVAVLRLQSEKADLRAKKQLAELLHGPVYGRLSACAMALNFHAEELARGDRSRTEYIMTTVLDYLATASTDLDALAST